MNTIPSFDEVEKIFRIFINIKIENWIHTQLFTFRWWILVFVTITPWIIWYMLLNKQRTKEILLYGMFTSMLMTYIDGIGTDISLWSYPVQLIPFLPRLLPLDFSLLPVLFMVIYQYTKSWKSYILSHLVIGSISSFIIIPFAIKIGLYKLINWNYFYSLLTFIFIALVGRWLITICIKVQNC